MTFVQKPPKFASMNQTAPQAQTLDSLSCEEALAELEGIVRELESGQGNLENAISQYERGTALRQHCMDKLQAARMKVEKIMQQPDGSLRTQPLDEE